MKKLKAKTLFEIVAENPTEFDQTEVNQYLAEFIKKYDTTNPIEKEKLGTELYFEFTYDLEQAMEDATNIDDREALLRGLGRAIETIFTYIPQNYPEQYQANLVERKKEVKDIFQGDGTYKAKIQYEGIAYVEQFAANAKNELISAFYWLNEARKNYN